MPHVSHRCNTHGHVLHVRSRPSAQCRGPMAMVFRIGGWSLWRRGTCPTTSQPGPAQSGVHLPVAPVTPRSRGRYRGTRGRSTWRSRRSAQRCACATSALRPSVAPPPRLQGHISQLLARTQHTTGNCAAERGSKDAHAARVRGIYSHGGARAMHPHEDGGR
jgi:hypothetical protein